MTGYSLSHPSIPILINLSRMLTLSPANGMGFVVRLKGTKHTLSWNAGQCMVKIIDSIVHIYKDGNECYVNMDALHQVLVMRDSKTYPAIFDDFIDICNNMPRDLFIPAAE